MVHLRSSVTLLVAAATAASTALMPASPALAKKDMSVPHIAYNKWDSGADVSTGVFNGTSVTSGALIIAAPAGTFAYTDPFGDGSTTTYDVATWTSPTITPGFNYSELVSSWNAHTPAGTWIQVAVHGKADDATTSKDYILGRWAEGTDAIHRTSVPAQGDDLASVAIDTLIARKKRSLSTWQLTLSLFRKAGTGASPSVTMLGAMASALPDNTKQLPGSPLGGAEGITLNVPTYSQEVHIGEYPEFDNGGEAWCSPTSTSMVLGYWHTGPSAADLAGIPYDDPQVDYAAANVFDYTYDGAGNWPFNTAYSARYDLEGFVTRLRSLTEAEQFIKAGIPLVASVSFKESELMGAGYGTDGHLMVIVGFTANGDVVANDPASHLIASNDQVRVVYDRAEFENIWLPAPRSGGIVYVVHPSGVPLPPAPAEANW
ncbi:MAG: peptidase C39 family protein [Nocardioidaceae bacterium]